MGTVTRDACAAREGTRGQGDTWTRGRSAGRIAHLPNPFIKLYIYTKAKMVPYVPFLQIVVSYPMNNLKHNSAQSGL